MGLSAEQIAASMRKAGFPESAIPTGVAVAMAESGGDPTQINTANRNGSRDYGLFQINTVHGSLLQQGDWRNPDDNAKMAYKVWVDAGRKWTPWAVYNSGSYTKFLSGVLPKTSTTNPPAQSSAGSGGEVRDGADVRNQNSGTYTPIVTGFGVFAEIWNAFVSPEFWNKFLLFLLAAFLIIAGTIVLLRKPIGTAAEVGVSAATKGVL